tara:strand:+ start:255 stop:470 length:216 start_codon:yes stop_codon:yes gene_type:complete
MLKLSDEALGALMMALQKSLLEQSDIVPVLKGFNFQTNEEGQLFVMNPPVFKVDPDKSLLESDHSLVEGAE